MYKLTTCKCGTDIMQDGCCGSEVAIFNCACGEKYLEEIKNKNKAKQDRKKNLSDLEGEK